LSHKAGRSSAASSSDTSTTVRGPNRREVLAALGAVGAASTLGCGPSPEAAPEDTGPTPVDDPRDRVEHLLFMMMENRSFDHMLGSLSLLEGRTDIDGLRAGLSNPGPNGEIIAPFPLTHECFVDPGHGWNSSRTQRSDGTCQGFVVDYAGRNPEAPQDAMGFLTRAGAPISYALADQYTVCDRWFSSVLGPTWPNRLYSLCGTSGGRTGNDANGPVPMQVPGIFKQLTDAGISWKIYGNYPWALLLEGGIAGTVPLEQLFEDLEDGELPQVAFVEPNFGVDDDHPPAPAKVGQVLIGSIVAALGASSYWRKSAFVLTYDEHGGLYDHVDPPKAADDLAEQGFDQLGFRVPALVVSPWALHTQCAHTVYDHTSILATIQDKFGLPPLTARNAAAAPLWDCFDHERMRAGVPLPPPVLPVVDLTSADRSSCFDEGTLDTGQPELEAFLDAGIVPKHLDRRKLSGLDRRRLFARAAALGVIR
jgi:phospholipase C